MEILDEDFRCAEREFLSAEAENHRRVCENAKGLVKLICNLLTSVEGLANLNKDEQALFKIAEGYATFAHR